MYSRKCRYSGFHRALFDDSHGQIPRQSQSQQLHFSQLHVFILKPQKCGRLQIRKQMCICMARWERFSLGKGLPGNCSTCMVLSSLAGVVFSEEVSSSKQNISS